MQVKISSGDIVEINKKSKILLVSEYQEKFPGYLDVKEIFETYVIAFTERNKKDGSRDFVAFSYLLVADIVSPQEIQKADLKPLVKTVLEEILPDLIGNAVKDAVKDKLIPQIFDNAAKAVVAAQVQNELGKALRQAANTIDPPKGK